MSCDQFYALVREQFTFLFEEYGFAVVHLEEATSRTDHCLMGLESTTCRILIYRTWEDTNVWIALPGARFGWDAHTDKQGPRWYPMEALIDFSHPRKRGRFQWGTFQPIEDILSLFAGEIKPIAPKIFAAIADPAARTELEVFMKSGWE